MANVSAIHSVGSSLVSYLRNTYPAELRQAHDCEFALFSSGEINKADDIPTTLSLYLYRVTQNEHLRNVQRPDRPADVPPPVVLDLHYLLTVWADNALAEHRILAWAIRELYLHSILDISSLDPDAGWGPGEVVHVIPAELSTEDVMRIWDALEPPYRLSVSYVARVVRIDPDSVESGRPVVATRFTYAGIEERA